MTEIHKCQCGFEWRHGMSGSHMCEPHYRKQIEALKNERDALAAENSTIKTMNDCLAEELRGYESDGAFDGPDMHKLWHSHASALPATDASIANIHAQGVDMAITVIKTMMSATAPAHHAIGMLKAQAAQLRKESTHD